jgi:hypothetical protein
LGTVDTVGKLLVEGDQNKKNERDWEKNREKENDRMIGEGNEDLRKGMGKRRPGLDKGEGLGKKKGRKNGWEKERGKQTMIGKRRGSRRITGKADDDWQKEGDWERRRGRRMTGSRNEDWKKGLGKKREEQEEEGSRKQH